MRTIKALVIINTVALLLVMLAVTGILKRQNEAAATYETYEPPPVTWEV